MRTGGAQSRIKMQKQEVDVGALAPNAKQQIKTIQAPLHNKLTCIYTCELTQGHNNI